MRNTKRLITQFMAPLGLICTVHAGEPVPIEPMPVEEPADPWNICDIYDLATLYSNKENRFMQMLAFTGRLQADAAFFDQDGGGDYERLLWRRTRTGLKTTLFDNFTLHSEVSWNLNDTEGDYYQGLTDTYLAWSNNDAFALKVGKQSVGFTGDGATSSKKLLRMERNVLSTNLWFPVEYFTGASVGGKSGNWSYKAGGFSSESGEDFGGFSAGYMGLLSLGYNFAGNLDLDDATIRLDYVHNEEDEKNTTRNLSDVVSLNGKFEKGKFGVCTDLAGGKGYGSQSDIFGLSVMPFYDITDKAQLVASYNYLKSDGENGLRLDRHESRIESGRSDKLHEFYLGFNYFFCGHKLKWQSGIEYTSTSDSANDGGGYDGLGASTGIRISW